MSQKPKVIFVCTHNSARSQMAEGLLRGIAGDKYEVFSAGTESTRVNPFAIKAMKELGIDISSHTSDVIDKFMHIDFDYVITVCDNANETCPYFLTTKSRLHWSFQDPSAAKGSDDEILAEFRRIRDQIESRIRAYYEIQHEE